ncbi:hypothetical protein A6M21_08830 [Desulfotomaculum copahuensis]|uniref:Uncharacterized protein n=1 Tax=Desulfotomaculum copahuensis TaxID=1838280 RepID=A0A1B7LF26_9FIRM|nr:hypothetical protein A6M21_08830 [Desulfotomaculum copahuensis]
MCLNRCGESGAGCQFSIASGDIFTTGGQESAMAELIFTRPFTLTFDMRFAKISFADGKKNPDGRGKGKPHPGE